MVAGYWVRGRGRSGPGRDVGICRALGLHALVGLCLGKKGGAEICWRVDRFSDEVVKSALEGNDVS